MIKLLLLVLTCASWLSVSTGFKYSLTRISTLYIPTYDAAGNPQYGFKSGAIEQLAYDPQDKIVYAVGAGIFHVFDVSDASKIKIVYHHTIPDTDFTDIEYCNGYVFYSVHNITDLESRLKGSVFVRKKYQKNSADSLTILHKIEVGSLPDMIKPTKDCRTVLVAIEAEAYGTGDDFRDPQGGVGVIKFPNGVDHPNTYTKLDFTAYNDKVAEMEQHGVRFIFRLYNNTFDRDVEPEYITYNTDETLAYICLQENNAIAVVDMTTVNIIAVHGLGYKSWQSVKLDPSDRDSGINLKTYDIRSFYQPDSIHYDTWNGKNIIVTANEGAVKDYENLIGWAEDNRGKKLADKVSDMVSPATEAALRKDHELGRLVFSSVDGLNDNNKHDHLYSYGGRSMSIRLASDMSVLYDSGGEIEYQIARKFPDLFNSVGKETQTVKENMDTRSDNKGPECESLATAVLGGRFVIFVGNERPGTISVFSVGDHFSATRYEFTYTGITQYNKTFKMMYKKRTVSEVDPEDIRYVPGSESPTNGPVLFVAGSVSGTFSILRINVIDNSRNRGSRHSYKLRRRSKRRRSKY